MAIGLDDIDFIAGGETDVFGFAGLEGADGGHDKGVSFTGGAVFDVEDDASFALVFDGLTFFESGCDNCHGMVVAVMMDGDGRDVADRVDEVIKVA